VVARIYDARRAQVYERLGIPTVATIRWAADRMVRQLVPEGTVEVFRDQTSVISIVEAPLHRDWVGRTVKALEEGTGARMAYLMRFGMGMLGTPSTVLQDGDQVYLLVTDDTVATVLDIAAGGAEKEGH
jgi:trk system potassium uptake protein TrkA